jgi:hypothetical protein
MADDECGAVGGMRIARETEILGENLPQCPSVHHKPYMTGLRIKPGQPWCKAGPMRCKGCSVFALLNT